MRHVGAIALIAVGTALVGVGLLFLIAAGDQAHRYLVGFVGAGLGGALAGFGVRAFRRAQALEPPALRAAILALAQKNDGRLAAADLAAALGEAMAPARPVLDDLIRDGVCAREEAEATTWYVFRDLLPRLAVRRCRHCGTELPLAEEVARCPSCGGDVRVGVERLALGDDEGELYSMDE